MTAALALSACGDDDAGDADGGADGGAVDGGGGSVDGASSAGVAPADAIAGEQPAAASNTISVPAAGRVVYRIESQPGEHVGFRLTYDQAAVGTGVVMAVSRWDGTMPVQIGETDAGAGLRVLAVIDQEMPRTYWVRIEAGARMLTGTLTVVRTPFNEGINCTSDCAKLLQLPLPNDERDGYLVNGAVFRYQFGRRDLLMFLRFAGRRMFNAGKAPFRPEDLSQWDGLTPGSDVGALRHASHQRGKDVDISLYGDDGLAPWRSYCTTENTANGRECIAGTLRGFDGYESARMYGAFLESGRVTMSFMDAELIGAVKPAAVRAAADGVVANSVLPLYSDGTHLQHWPNHDNHIHIRVSEALPATPGTNTQPIVVFEAP